MNEIPGVWSLAALLLFGGALTALAAGAAILLAEIGFKKCAEEESSSKLGKTGNSKLGKSGSENPFSGSVATRKKAQSRSKQGKAKPSPSLIEHK